MAWAIERAPDVPARCVTVLLGLANHADQYGEAAYPSNATLMTYSRKSESQVRRDLQALLRLGLIRRGDQRRVAHLDPRHRPTVYDLAMERTESRGVTHDTSTDSGVSPMPPRGVTGARPGVSPTTPKPSLNRPRTEKSADGSIWCLRCDFHTYPGDEALTAHLDECFGAGE